MIFHAVHTNVGTSFFRFVTRVTSKVICLLMGDPNFYKTREFRRFGY